MFAVLERPQDFWEVGNLEQRRIIQSLLFTGPIEYSARDGFGTTTFSLPFKLLQLDRQEKPELVEVARIELASASPLPRGLHAYSVINLTAGYPTGRENSQPVL